jgi:hypothetical protein
LSLTDIFSFFFFVTLIYPPDFGTGVFSGRSVPADGPNSAPLITLGERRGVYRVLVGKPEGKRPLGRPRRRWEDHIKMDFQEVGCGGMDWVGLAQDRDRWWVVVYVVMNLQVP